MVRRKSLLGIQPDVVLVEPQRVASVGEILAEKGVRSSLQALQEEREAVPSVQARAAPGQTRWEEGKSRTIGWGLQPWNTGLSSGSPASCRQIDAWGRGIV